MNLSKALFLVALITLNVLLVSVSSIESPDVTNFDDKVKRDDECSVVVLPPVSKNKNVPACRDKST
jgi:hypothetical protein